jgi:hypothetical protein
VRMLSRHLACPVELLGSRDLKRKAFRFRSWIERQSERELVPALRLRPGEADLLVSYRLTRQSFAVRSRAAICNGETNGGCWLINNVR